MLWIWPVLGWPCCSGVMLLVIDMLGDKMFLGSWPCNLTWEFGLFAWKMNVMLWYGSLSGSSAKGHTCFLLIGLEWLLRELSLWSCCNLVFFGHGRSPFPALRHEGNYNTQDSEETYFELDVLLSDMLGDENLSWFEALYDIWPILNRQLAQG